MIWNETKDWIFSSEYHDWQEDGAGGTYRPGTCRQITETGWYIGLYMIKEDETGPGPDYSYASRWPEPLGNNDLDKYDSINGRSTRWML